MTDWQYVSDEALPSPPAPDNLPASALGADRVDRFHTARSHAPRAATLPDVHIPDSLHAESSPLTQVALTPSVDPDPVPLPALEEAPPLPALQRENTDTSNVTDMMEEINRINRRLKPPKARPTAEPTNKTTAASPTPTL